MSRFKVRLSEVIDRNIPLSGEHGSNLSEKVLNSLIREDFDSRTIARLMVDYVNYDTAINVIFVNIVDSDLYERAIRNKIIKTVIDGKIAFGYYKESENQNKFFVSEKPEVKLEDYGKIIVKDHSREWLSKFTIKHTAIVECASVPRVSDIAIACGYHPAGYGARDAVINILNADTNQYIVTWLSGSSCD